MIDVEITNDGMLASEPLLMDEQSETQSESHQPLQHCESAINVIMDSNFDDKEMVSVESTLESVEIIQNDLMSQPTMNIGTLKDEHETADCDDEISFDDSVNQGSVDSTFTTCNDPLSYEANGFDADAKDDESIGYISEDLKNYILGIGPQLEQQRNDFKNFDPSVSASTNTEVKSISNIKANIGTADVGTALQVSASINTEIHSSSNIQANIGTDSGTTVQETNAAHLMDNVDKMSNAKFAASFLKCRRSQRLHRKGICSDNETAKSLVKISKRTLAETIAEPPQKIFRPNDFSEY